MMNEIDGFETREFEKEMHLCVFLDGILVELENCSNDEMEGVENELGSIDQLFVWVIEIPNIDPRADYVGDGIQ